MQSIYQAIMKNAILRAVIFTVLGLLMLIFPQLLVDIIVFIIGGALVLFGAISIINYISGSSGKSEQINLVIGIFLVLLGVVVFIFSRQIVSIMPIFLGIILITGGVVELIETLSAAKSAGRPNWVLLGLGALIIIGGIVVVLNPFESLLTLFRIVGVVMLLLGISVFISYFGYKNS